MGQEELEKQWFQKSKETGQERNTKQETGRAQRREGRSFEEYFDICTSLNTNVDGWSRRIKAQERGSQMCTQQKVRLVEPDICLLRVDPMSSFAIVSAGLATLSISDAQRAILVVEPTGAQVGAHAWKRSGYRLARLTLVLETVSDLVSMPDHDRWCCNRGCDEQGWSSGRRSAVEEFGRAFEPATSGTSSVRSIPPRVRSGSSYPVNYRASSAGVLRRLAVGVVDLLQRHELQSTCDASQMR